MREDFLLNDNGDFPLQDTVIGGVYLPTPYGESDGQHIRSMIRYSPGSLKYAPTFGFGAYKYINKEFDLQSVARSLNIEAGKDGYTTKPGVVSPPDEGGNGFVINGLLIESR